MDSGFLTQGNPKSWVLMPQALARIKKFSEEQDGRGDAGLWCAAVVQAFAASDPDLVVVVVEDNGQVVAHSLCGIEQHLGFKYVMVYQYSFDAALPREVTERYIAQLEMWGRRKGAQEFRALVEGPVRERAYRMYYGFKTAKTLMVRPFSGEEK